jgi:hypothetical protein
MASNNNAEESFAAGATEIAGRSEENENQVSTMTVTNNSAEDTGEKKRARR